jgi:hypothetical protein
MNEPLRATCGERALLPERLARGASELAHGARDADAERHLRCVLEAHTTGDHRAFVLEGAAAGSVCTRWTRGNPPDAVFVLPDCGTTGPAPVREPCCEFRGHPGGHTWQLTDPWRPRPAAEPAD